MASRGFIGCHMFRPRILCANSFYLFIYNCYRQPLVQFVHVFTFLRDRDSSQQTYGNPPIALTEEPMNEEGLQYTHTGALVRNVRSELSW